MVDRVDFFVWERRIQILQHRKHWPLGPIGAHPNSKGSANPSLQLRPAVEEAHHWLLRQQTQPGRKQLHRSIHFLSGGCNDHSGESYVIIFWKAIGLDRIKKMHCHLSHLECIWVSPCVKRCHYPQKRKQQVRGFRPSSSHMWCYDIFIYVYDCTCSIWVPQVVWFHRSPFKRCARNLSKRTVPWCHCDAARHALNSAVNLEVLNQGYTFTPVIHQGIKRNQASNCVSITMAFWVILFILKALFDRCIIHSLAVECCEW